MCQAPFDDKVPERLRDKKRKWQDVLVGIRLEPLVLEKEKVSYFISYYYFCCYFQV